jgi:8-oxo-dGTP pyrophosphatase MutT (NUDIX family)
MDPDGQQQQQQVVGELKDVFQDLEFRFISNLHPSELKSERLFFHLEQAWWLYEDELSDKHKHLPHFKFEEFAREFFKRSSILMPFRPQFDTMYATFKDYQHRIPVYGCALLTADLSKVLLVTGFRSQNSWGFPKGKINQSEDELVCALREVYEEVGFDATYLNPKKEDKMTWNQKNGKTIKIFIVPGVPEDFAFAPRVVKEIDEIKWWKISDLPAGGGSNATAAGAAAKNKFWGVSAFVPQLRRWIARKQNIALPPSEEDEVELEAAESGGGHEFPVEEMFKVNKVLREKELRKTTSASSAGTPPAKTTNAKKERQQATKASKAANQQTTAVTAIAKNPNRVQQGSPSKMATDNSNIFVIDFARVSRAMRPYLN